MRDPYVRTIDYIEDIDGLRLLVGVNYDAVTIGFVGEARWSLTQAQAEEFAQLFVSACWQAGANARQMAEEIHEADGGDTMAEPNPVVPGCQDPMCGGECGG
jgi:hypothetical protein